MIDDWDSHHTMLGLNHLTSFMESENFLEWCNIYPLMINSNGHTTTDSTHDHNIGLSQVTEVTQVTYKYVVLVIDRK